MDYEAKLRLAHKELNEKGVWKSNYNPPIVKWLRTLGMCFPPPYYQSYFANVMLCVTFFAPVWGIFQWFFVWNELGKPVLEAVFISLLAGTLFGFVMATFYYIRRKQLNLTDWGSLGEYAQNLTKRLRRIHNAWHSQFASALMFTAQWFRLGGSVVHHLTRRYVYLQLKGLKVLGFGFLSLWQFVPSRLSKSALSASILESLRP